MSDKITDTVRNRIALNIKRLSVIAEDMDALYNDELEKDTSIKEDDSLYAFFMAFTDSMLQAATHLRRAYGRTTRIDGDLEN